MSPPLSRFHWLGCFAWASCPGRFTLQISDFTSSTREFSELGDYLHFPPLLSCLAGLMASRHQANGSHSAPRASVHDSLFFVVVASIFKVWTLDFAVLRSARDDPETIFRLTLRLVLRCSELLRWSGVTILVVWCFST